MKKIIMLTLTICLLSQIRAEDTKEKFTARLLPLPLIGKVFAYADACVQPLTTVEIEDPMNNNVKTKIFKDIATTTVITSDIEGKAVVGLHPTETDCIIVAFRGTANLCNAKDDLEINAVDSNSILGTCAGCKVHSGFQKHYLALRVKVVQTVRNLISANKNIKRIAITGHSLGGATANLAAKDLHNQTGKLIDLMTFGSPRVGNDKFAGTLNLIASHHIRIVTAQDTGSNNSDVVTTIPWSPLYQHAGTQITIVTKEGSQANAQRGLLTDQSAILALARKTDEKYHDLFTKQILDVAKFDCKAQDTTNLGIFLVKKLSSVIKTIYDAENGNQSDSNELFSSMRVAFAGLTTIIPGIEGDKTLGFGSMTDTSGNASDQSDLKLMITNHSDYQLYKKYPALISAFYLYSNSSLLTKKSELQTLYGSNLNSTNKKKLKK